MAHGIPTQLNGNTFNSNPFPIDLPPNGIPFGAVIVVGVIFDIK